MRFADDPAGPPPPLAARWRALGLAAGWAVFWAAGPGAVGDAGSVGGLFGVALWALVARRPGPRAKTLEWLAGAVGLSSQLWWIGIVFPLAMVHVFVGCGLYALTMGVLLRRLSRRFRPALAVPMAWMGLESLRMIVPPPIGLSWLSLGHYALDAPGLAGSARVWGWVGLSYGLAALAGLVVEWAEWRRGLRPLWDRWSVVFGLGPALLAAGLGALTRAPETVPGPRLLLVQPAFPQWRKQSSGTARELFREQLQMTQAAIAAERDAGRPAPDLVCWGETMLRVATLADERLEAAAEAGLELDPWWPFTSEELPRLARLLAQDERSWIGGVLFGVGAARSSAALPEGTAFLAGAEMLVPHEGELRRQNVVALWSAGERRGLTAKRHLAPGGETMHGLERFDAVRAYIYDVAGYVPDFLPGEGTGVLELETAGERAYRFAATVCFDNAFPQAYAEPVAAGPVDFHLVVSNEAWYRRSCEMEQMIAFSRLEALATGRAFARATNAGITALIGPDGEVLERLVVDGEDELVTGTLAVTVPVPADPDAGAPPFVHLWALWNALALALPALLAWVAGRRTVTSGGSAGSSQARRGAPARA